MAAPDPPLTARQTPGQQEWHPTHRHRKGGLYRVFAEGINETDRKPVVIYQDETGQIWVRPAEEFWDGRFTPIGED